MDKQYSPIAKIKIFHEYYTDGRATPLQLKPSPLTSQRLKDLGIRLRASSGEITMYLGHTLTDKGFEEKLAGLPDKTALVFSLWADSADDLITFNHTTNLPIEELKNRAYWYTNTSKDDNSLSIGEFASAEDIVSHTGPHHELQLPSGRPQYAYVYNSSGQLQYQERIGTSGAREWSFDLSGYDWGTYHLGFSSDKPVQALDPHLLENVTSLTYIPSDIANQSLGFVALLIERNQLDEVQQFDLKFDARLSLWRYHLIQKSALDFEVINLKLGKADTSFKGPVEVELRDGTLAHSITILTPFKFSVSQPEKIALELFRAPASANLGEGFATSLDSIDLTKEDLDLALSILLPKPTPRQIKVERVEGDLTVFSDMFVYL